MIGGRQMLVIGAYFFFSFSFVFSLGLIFLLVFFFFFFLFTLSLGFIYFLVIFSLDECREIKVMRSSNRRIRGLLCECGAGVIF